MQMDIALENLFSIDNGKRGNFFFLHKFHGLRERRVFVYCFGISCHHLIDSFPFKGNTVSNHAAHITIRQNSQKSIFFVGDRSEEHTSELPVTATSRMP